MRSAGRQDFQFVQALAAAVLADAVPGLTPGEQDGAARFTAERLSMAPAFTRLGMQAVGGLLDAQVRIAERTAFASLAPDRRARWVARWRARPLPGITDYVDAVRGLALTWLYEQRAA